MILTDQDLEIEAKALLKRAARIENEAITQREQASRVIKHLAESPAGGEELAGLERCGEMQRPRRDYRGDQCGPAPLQELEKDWSGKSP